jgi:hypothetical protein
MPSATKPGIKAAAGIRPSAVNSANIKTTTIGLPKIAAIAASAVISMPNFITGSGWRRSTKAPAAVPQASSGASGPSTRPKISVPVAARMTEAKVAGVTSKWSPSSGP